MSMKRGNWIGTPSSKIGVMGKNAWRGEKQRRARAMVIKAERTNNPGNVHETPGRAWQGQVAVEGDGQLVFGTAEDGWRCLLRTIWSKVRHGKNTVELMGAGWLNGCTEEAVKDWVETVHGGSGFMRWIPISQRDESLTDGDVMSLHRLACAIEKAESGHHWVPMPAKLRALARVVEEGWEGGRDR
jgi:hypothetical protein